MRIRSLLLFAAVCLSAAVCPAQTKSVSTLVQGQQTVTFSATPAFDANKANAFKLVLTGNVTSSTLTHADPGQMVQFEICQDATGGRTFVAPANVQGFLAISSTASACTTQQFLYDGANAQPFIATATVSAVNGVSFPASPSTHSVPVTTAANTETYKVVPDCTDTAGNHLNYTQSGDTWSCGTSVPANVVTTTTLASPPAIGGTAPNTGKFTTLTGTGDTQVKRIKANQATALVSGDFAASVGWGSTAAFSAISGTDAAFTFTITANGTSIAANPTITLTFHDGTWTNTPIIVVSRGDGSSPLTGFWITQAGSSATQAILQFIGTPLAASSYVAYASVTGR
jgi:hypothetical protein